MRELDLHYIPSRYPNGLPSGYPHQFYDEETAQRALKAAEKIFAIVEDHYKATERKRYSRRVIPLRVAPVYPTE